MRINEYVAAASGLSRRAADTAITGGRVTISGRPAVLGQPVTSDDDVTLDGKPLRPPQTHSYVMLHKPAGYVSSRTRQGKDATLYDLLPKQYHSLRIAGRLDKDSSGLILLSDDGEFINRHTHPSFGKTKVYEVTLSKPLIGSDRTKLESGVELIDGPSRLHVERSSGRNVTVSLGEGRNRQVRRTFGALGYDVEQLHRVKMGEHTLGKLAPGKWRKINQ